MTNGRTFEQRAEAARRHRAELTREKEPTKAHKVEETEYRTLEQRVDAARKKLTRLKRELEHAKQGIKKNEHQAEAARKQRPKLTREQERERTKARMIADNKHRLKPTKHATGKKLGEEEKPRVMNKALQRITLDRMKAARVKKADAEASPDEYYLGDDEADWIDPSLSLEENFQNQAANIREYAFTYSDRAPKPEFKSKKGKTKKNDKKKRKK